MLTRAIPRKKSGGGEITDWKFTVNTRAHVSSQKTSSIPFNLYGQDTVTLDVDWGDGTTSTLTSADYTELDSTASVHEYTTAGTYQITVSSADWEDVYFLTVAKAVSLTLNDAVAPVYWFRRTIISVDDVFPLMSGTMAYTAAAPDSSQKKDNDFSWLFYNCEHMVSVPTNLVDALDDSTSFQNIFSGCSSLTNAITFKGKNKVTSFASSFYNCKFSSLPDDVFSGCTAVTTFSGVCNHCSNLTALPSGIFDDCTEAKNFTQAFESTKISSLDRHLFDNCLNITNVSSCFKDCSSLGGFYINFYSTKISIVSTFCTKVEGVTRKIAVVPGSTTETKFNSVAASLGLTILGTLAS